MNKELLTTIQTQVESLKAQRVSAIEVAVRKNYAETVEPGISALSAKREKAKLDAKALYDKECQGIDADFAAGKENLISENKTQVTLIVGAEYDEAIGKMEAILK